MSGIRTKFYPMGGASSSTVQYTLTVTLNPASATCTLTYDGTSYSTTSATVPSGTVISYSIYHSTYGTQTGTVTMNADKTLTATGTYSTSTTETSWSQPTLSSNGTIGSSSFAVQASSEYSTYYAWKAFDNTASTAWAVQSAGSTSLPATMLIYSSTPIKVSSITITNRSGYNIGFTSGSVSAGNTSSASTVLVSSWSNSNVTSGSSWNIRVGSSNFYNYHKITVTGFNNGTYRPQCVQIDLNAKKQQTSYTFYWNIDWYVRN